MNFIKLMRIWDIPPKQLCRQHLLGEHHELHAIWSILVNNKKGYSQHPETLRWKGKLKALYFVHDEIVKEMEKIGYEHSSPIEEKLATGDKEQKIFVDSIEEQMKILTSKKCECKF